MLSEFRTRLVEADAGQRVFDRVLDAARQAGVLEPPGRARTDSTRVLAAIRSLNRLEFVIETLRAALAAQAPQGEGGSRASRSTLVAVPPPAPRLRGVQRGRRVLSAEGLPLLSDRSSGARGTGTWPIIDSASRTPARLAKPTA